MLWILFYSFKGDKKNVLYRLNSYQKYNVSNYLKAVYSMFEYIESLSYLNIPQNRNQHLSNLSDLSKVCFPQHHEHSAYHEYCLGAEKSMHAATLCARIACCLYLSGKGRVAHRSEYLKICRAVNASAYWKLSW